MNPGYDDAMRSYLVGGFVRHIRRAIPAIATCLAMLVMVPTIMTPITTTARAGDAPINLCDYSGPTFDEVNALLHDRVRPGDHVDRLRNLLSATPGFQAGDAIPARFLNFKGSIWEGTFEFKQPRIVSQQMLQRGGAVCRRQAGNLDLWHVIVHRKKDGEIITFQLALFYDDEVFTARNEKLNVNRYFDVGRNSREIERTIKEVWKEGRIKANALFAMLREAGFVDYATSDSFAGESWRAKPEVSLVSGRKLAVFSGMLAVPNTALSDKSLLFRTGIWMADSNWELFITYNPETDEIISISADPPKPE